MYFFALSHEPPAFDIKIANNTPVTVTPASDTSATVAVPSAIYNQSDGTTIEIKVTNSDNKTSNIRTLTVAAQASGGTVVTSGGYKYHTFIFINFYINFFFFNYKKYLI